MDTRQTTHHAMERHPASASHLPARAAGTRLLNALGHVIAECETNHNAHLLELLVNAGASTVFKGGQT